MGRERPPLFWKIVSVGERKQVVGKEPVNEIFLRGVAPPARGAGGIPTSPLCPPGLPIPPSNGRGIPPDPPLYRHGHFPLSLDRQGPYRARDLVWLWASNQSGAASGTHIAWHLNRGTYRNRVSLPQRPLADTPRIDRRRRAGGGISCARPRFRQRRIRGSRSDLAFTK